MKARGVVKTKMKVKAGVPGWEEEEEETSDNAALLGPTGDGGDADGDRSRSIGGSVGAVGPGHATGSRRRRARRRRPVFLCSCAKLKLLFASSVVAATAMAGMGMALFFIIITIRRSIRAHEDQDQGRFRHFPFNPECPYVLRTPEERLRVHNPAVPGNILTLVDFRFGRLGNRFWILGVALKLGYCCKSKLVSLPPKDRTLAPGVFGKGTPGPRWYDFTSAPDVEGFDASSCPAEITWNGREAFHLTGLDNPSLSLCISTVPRLTGCEASYYFPMDQDGDADVCLTSADQTAAGNVDVDVGVGVDVDSDDSDADGVLERRSNARSGGWGSAAAAAAAGGGGWGGDPNPVGGQEVERQHAHEAAAGNLVVHVRSGDVFVDPVLPGYGQPPLQYYVRAIQHQEWDRVDIVTNGRTKNNITLNPVVPALEAMVKDGELTGNIHFHKDRTMEEDFLSMICVDGGGLVVVRSSLALALAHHSRATRLYFHGSCSESLKFYSRGRPNASLNDLGEELKEVKVYGVRSSDTERYSPSVSWNNTADQIREMLTFNVSGFEQCIGNSESSVE